MKNVSASIVIFFVTIFLGVLVFFDFFYQEESGGEKLNVEESQFLSNAKVRRCYVSDVQGTLESKKEGESGWANFVEGNFMDCNVELKTGGGTRAVMFFDNGVSVRMDGGTGLKVFSDTEKEGLNLSAGKIESNVALKNGAVFVFEIGEYVAKTSQASIILGINENQDISLLVLDGEVSVSKNDGTSTEAISSGNVAEIVSGNLSKRALTENDVAGDFVLWSIGKGRLDKAVSEIDKNGGEKKDENVNQDL